MVKKDSMRDKKKRVWSPKLRAVTMQDRRTKRNRTRQQQNLKWRKEQ